MKSSMTLILAAVGFLYTASFVANEEWGYFDIPDAALYPIAPGLWVGAAVYFKVTCNIWIGYAAGIGTMTVLGALLGALFDWLADKSPASPPQ